jgi:predicted MFS family arabinose efflux permease
MTVLEPANTLRERSRVLLLLAVGTFAVGTDAFVLSGLLPSMSADLGISLSTTGLLVTLFAVTYAISAPLVAAFTAGWNRRVLLITAQLVFIVGMVLQAAGNGAVLLGVGRVVAAIGASGYTSAAAAVAAALVTPALRGRALAVVLGGVSVAIIFGVPIGIFVGQWLGWRATLLGVAGLGGLAALGALSVPALRLPVPGIRVRLAALGRPGVPGVLSVTVAALTAGFTMYTYLPAVLAPVVDAGMLGWIMLIYGCASTLGNALAGRWTDRIGPMRVLRLGLAGLALGSLLTPFARHNLITAVATVIILWPGAAWAAVVPQQHRLIAMGPDVAPVLLGWNASATYVGIALGSVLGGITLHLGSPVWLGPVSTVCALTALLLTMLRVRKPAVPSS